MLASLIRTLLRPRNPAGRKKIDLRWLENTLRLRQQGHHQEVIAQCRIALIQDPDNADVLSLLATELLALGQTKEGIAQLRRSSSLAATAQSHILLGEVLAMTGDFDGATESYRAAVGLDSKHVEAWEKLGMLQKILARYDDAERCCRDGLRDHPHHAALHHLLGTILFEQGRVDAAIASLRDAVKLDPKDARAHSELLRALNYSDRQDPVAIYNEHRTWAKIHAQQFEFKQFFYNNRPDPSRRLRVGFVSPYLRKHAVAFFLESVLEYHDPDNFEIFLYADVARPDAYSERLKAHGACWRSTAKLDDAELARLVHDDVIDILVDLSGHTAGNRLLAFARKPAPVQVNWLGFPCTTGMDSMDYRITDVHCDPPGMSEHLNSETLIRLPRIYMAWKPPDTVPEVTPLPALANGHVTFGTFHSVFKITGTIVKLWARILLQVPNARLQVMAISGENAKKHVRALFAECGIASDRVHVLPRLPFDDYLAAFNSVDIALDTFPYHGATTTCFSLWMGLPVVVLAGTTHATRADVSMLNNVGLPQLVASSGDEYIDIATRLTGDLARLAQLRARLRGMMTSSPTTDGRTCARNLESAFRDMWVAWCDKHAQ